MGNSRTFMNDQQLFDTVNKITNTQSLFSMSGFSVKESPYKNRRDELIKTTVEDINRLRVSTKYKPITARWLSIKCNLNPFLKDDGELDFVIKECKRVGNYKKLFWLLK